jgi:multidrug efflux pump subunit AcrA (membrane-fusion protein)
LRDLADLFRRLMNAEARSRKILGRIFSVTIILAAVLLAWAVAVDLRNNPRTDDAQVRANVIGISAQVGGAVKEIRVVDNQAVQRGDLLVELDARPYAAEVELARARLGLTELEIQADEKQIAAAEATLKEREARAVYARSYFERLPGLVREQFITPDKLESAQAEAQALEAQVKIAQAELDRARNLLGEVNGRNTRREAAAATLRDAGLKLSYCRIFDILISGSGNDITVFLVALITTFAGLAGLMQVRKTWVPALAQGGAMFAVAAPMLPAPDLSLAAMATRVEAVCAGCMVVAGLFGLLSCLTPFLRTETKK